MAEIWLRQYAIKWSFLFNLSQLMSLHYLGKYEPRKLCISVMLADNAAGVHERRRTSSHCLPHSRDRSASGLVMLQ